MTCGSRSSPRATYDEKLDSCSPTSSSALSYMRRTSFARGSALDDELGESAVVLQGVACEESGVAAASVDSSALMLLPPPLLLLLLLAVSSLLLFGVLTGVCFALLLSCATLIGVDLAALLLVGDCELVAFDVPGMSAGLSLKPSSASSSSSYSRMAVRRESSSRNSRSLM